MCLLKLHVFKHIQRIVTLLQFLIGAAIGRCPPTLH